MNTIKTFYKQIASSVLVIVLVISWGASKFIWRNAEDKTSPPASKKSDPVFPGLQSVFGSGPTYETCSTNTCSSNTCSTGNNCGYCSSCWDDTCLVWTDTCTATNTCSTATCSSDTCAWICE